MQISDSADAEQWNRPPCAARIVRYVLWEATAWQASGTDWSALARRPVSVRNGWPRGWAWSARQSCAGNAARRVRNPGPDRNLRVPWVPQIKHYRHYLDVNGIRSEWAPAVLCEALSRRPGRTVTLDELGLTVQLLSSLTALDWRADTLIALTDLGKVDVDMERRRVLAAATYSVAALAVPDEP